MGAILYYLLIKPLSLLPLPALYRLSGMLYFLIYKVAGYRRKVVQTNLRNSFPGKSSKEILQIESRFYRHLCDLMVESISLFSMGDAEFMERFKIVNGADLQPFYDQNKPVMIVMGHYNNWEWLATGVEPQIPHWAVGIYTPLSNKFMERKMYESRGRYGIALVPKAKIKDFLAEKHDRPLAIFFGSDQSPSSANKAYWTTFLNQDTAVAFGAEKYAREFDAPLFFGHINKVKRGYYEVWFELLEAHPNTRQPGELTELHVRALEKRILQEPANWLWTHRRWKRKREVEPQA
mgnify:FL=1